MASPRKALWSAVGKTREGGWRHRRGGGRDERRLADGRALSERGAGGAKVCHCILAARNPPPATSARQSKSGVAPASAGFPPHSKIAQLQPALFDRALRRLFHSACLVFWRFGRHYLPILLIFARQTIERTIDRGANPKLRSARHRLLKSLFRFAAMAHAELRER
jgi:hypothetical protein